MKKTLAFLTVAILAIAAQAYASSNVLVKDEVAHNRCVLTPCGR